MEQLPMENYIQNMEYWAWACLQTKLMASDGLNQSLNSILLAHVSNTSQNV